MADDRAISAEGVISRPAGVTLLPDEQSDSQAVLGQSAAGRIDEHPAPAFKVFHEKLNIPTGEEQVSLGAPGTLPAGVRPNLKPTPPAMNVPTGEEQVTVGR